MTPVLLIVTARERYYIAFWKLIRIWAFFLIYAMGFRLKISEEQKLDHNQSYMFCPNHASLMDPFVLIAISKNPIVFIGKKELVKVPVFGFFYKKVVIIVDRSSYTSRKKVYERAKKKLKNGVSMGIFPEGLVPEMDVILSPFKKGAFNLAIEHQIPIVPQTYYDCKRLFSWDILKGGMGTLRVKQHHFIETKNRDISEADSLKDQVFDVIYNELYNDELYMKNTDHYNEKKSNS